MFAIELQNPVLEKLAKEIFADEPVVDNPQFLEFLLQQKINKDLEKSIAEMKQGKTHQLNNAFSQTFKRLGI
jgi:hypothetical protein